ncbi:MAG: patatin-like phospholipase family protein [Wenzhouxiangella sp.]
MKTAKSWLNAVWLPKALAPVSLALLLTLSGCATRNVGPINAFAPDANQLPPFGQAEFADDQSLLVGVAFSGGGTRAAAFAFGVLNELDALQIDSESRRQTVANNIRMVSGTSGGAVLAAYFGLRGPDHFHDFKERFLLQDVEASLHTSFGSPANLVRAVRGGMNDRDRFAKWLDEHLFVGATYADLYQDHGILVWLNATDIHYGEPFLFTRETFAALCSDLNRVRLADAVAASAAFPVAFLPLEVLAFGSACDHPVPEWQQRALNDPHAPVRLRAHARTLAAYRSYTEPTRVRLLDGGITDNIGITGLALSRASSETLHGPLSARQAVAVDELLFIATDAGKSSKPAWAERASVPTLAQIGPALATATIAASVRKGFDALQLALADWQQDIVRFRCSLPLAQIREIRGTLDDWDCARVNMTVQLLSFSDLDEEQRRRLDRIPTRLSLPNEEVDLLIEAGREAVRRNLAIQEALDSLRVHQPVSASLQ